MISATRKVTLRSHSSLAFLRASCNGVFPYVYPGQVAVLPQEARQLQGGIAGATGDIQHLPAYIAREGQKDAEQQSPKRSRPLRHDKSFIELYEAGIAQIVGHGEIIGGLGTGAGSQSGRA